MEAPLPIEGNHGLAAFVEVERLGLRYARAHQKQQGQEAAKSK